MDVLLPLALTGVLLWLVCRACLARMQGASTFRRGLVAMLALAAWLVLVLLLAGICAQSPPGPPHIVPSTSPSV
jgi:hypothetical protein